jgi:hypothetical protein
MRQVWEVHHMKWFILESFPVAWLEILEWYDWSTCPVDTTVYSPPMSLNNRHTDESLTFSFKAICRRRRDKCSTRWRTCAWFSCVKRVTGQLDFPYPWHSTLPEWRHFVMIHSITMSLSAALLNLSWNCSATFFILGPTSRPLPYELK